MKWGGNYLKIELPPLFKHIFIYIVVVTYT